MDRTDRDIDITQAARVAFIQARWHAGLVDRCREGFAAELARSDGAGPGGGGAGIGGAEAPVMEVFDVPGAFEAPLLARRLAATGRYAAVVVAAFVVDGGVYRHEFVAQTVVSALMQAGLETGVPVLSASLTPQAYQETAAHDAFFAEHLELKGREAAQACRAVLAAHARAAALEAAG